MADNAPDLFSTYFEIKPSAPPAASDTPALSDEQRRKLLGQKGYDKVFGDDIRSAPTSSPAVVNNAMIANSRMMPLNTDIYKTNASPTTTSDTDKDELNAMNRYRRAAASSQPAPASATEPRTNSLIPQTITPDGPQNLPQNPPPNTTNVGYPLRLTGPDQQTMTPDGPQGNYMMTPAPSGQATYVPAYDPRGFNQTMPGQPSPTPASYAPEGTGGANLDALRRQFIDAHYGIADPRDFDQLLASITTPPR